MKKFSILIKVLIYLNVLRLLFVFFSFMNADLQIISDWAVNVGYSQTSGPAIEYDMFPTGVLLLRLGLITLLILTTTDLILSLKK